MKKRLSMILACLFLFVGMALAQTTISGTVISQEDGEPIIGASVMVDGGSKVGTVTDTDGHFSLSVPAGKKLVISYIGMKSQTVVAKPNMKVTLQSDDRTLGEVVVTGLTTQDKRLFSGAATKIDASKAKRRRSVCVALLLFLVARSRCGSSMVSSWRTLPTSTPAHCHRATPRL